MKRIRNLGLAAVMVLALTATVGVGSASASSEFEAAEYPAEVVGTFSGELGLRFGGWGGSLSCEGPSLSGQFNANSRSITVTPKDSICYKYGEFKMNGCTFKLRPGAEAGAGKYLGTMEIGPAGCGPITIGSLAFCKWSIPSQTGLTVQYTNGSGGKNAVTLSIAGPQNMRYVKEGPGCVDEEREDGYFEGSWVLSAKQVGSPNLLDLKVQKSEGSFAAQLESGTYPASLSGATEQEPEEELAPHKWTLSNRQITCSTTNLAGTISSAVTSFDLTASYVCKDSAGPTVTVTMNSCRYAANVTTPSAAALAITCTTKGDMIVLKWASIECRAEIPAQSGIGTVSLQNRESGTDRHVGLTWQLSKMKYTTIKEGFLCPFKNATLEDGTYVGETALRAKNAGGLRQALEVRD